MVSVVRLVGDDYSRVTLVKEEDAERNGLANAPLLHTRRDYDLSWFITRA